MQILRTEQREAWMQVLEESGQYDFYHLPGYHELAQSQGEGTGHLFVYREANHCIALPLLIRGLETIPGLEEAGSGRKDATSVYGYAGPVFSGAEAEIGHHFRSALRDCLQKMGVIAGFSRLHPLIAQRPILAGLGECVLGGKTVSIDLTLPVEEQRMKYRSDHKRAINKARRLGMTLCEDTGMAHLGRFIEIYAATMRRVGAHSYYFFDAGYFERLAAELGDALKLFVIMLGSEVVCGGLFAICNGIVQYHLGGTADEHRAAAPMKLLVDAVRAWAVERGCRVLHLGGGVGSQADSLFHFKLGFSDRTHDFFTWRWVLDPQVFEELAVEKARWNAANGKIPVSAGYFPSYRALSVPITSEDVVADRIDSDSES